SLPAHRRGCRQPALSSRLASEVSPGGPVGPCRDALERTLGREGGGAGCADRDARSDARSRASVRGRPADRRAATPGEPVQGLHLARLATGVPAPALAPAGTVGQELLYRPGWSRLRGGDQTPHRQPEGAVLNAQSVQVSPVSDGATRAGDGRDA